MFLESLMLKLQDDGGCKSDKVRFILKDPSPFSPISSENLKLDEVRNAEGVTYIILTQEV